MDTSAALPNPSLTKVPHVTINMYLYWTAVAILVLYVLALLVTVFLSRYFDPASDVYDDCSPTDVKFLYSVRVRAHDVHPTFLDGKKSLVVILQSGGVCLCRWRLSLSGVSRFKMRNRLFSFKFRVGRRSALTNVTSMRLDHTCFEHKIFIENIQILDMSSGVTVFAAQVRRRIARTNVVCGHDDRQVFAMSPDLPVTAVAHSDAPIRVRLFPVEYSAFIFLALSILMFFSVRTPHDSQNLTYWKAVANSFCAAVIAIMVTFVLFAAYKVLVRPLFSPQLTKICVPALLFALTLLLLAGTVYENLAKEASIRQSGTETTSGGHMWLTGFIFGTFLILGTGWLFHLLLTTCINIWLQKKEHTTVTASEAPSLPLVPKVRTGRPLSAKEASTSPLSSASASASSSISSKK